MLGLAMLGVGAARPQATVPVRVQLDDDHAGAWTCPGSMCSTDVEPNRITVAQKAAIAFIKAQAGGARIGLVAFAGVAGLQVPPTTDTDKLIEAINNLLHGPRYGDRLGDPHLDRRHRRDRPDRGAHRCRCRSRPSGRATRRT